MFTVMAVIHPKVISLAVVGCYHTRFSRPLELQSQCQIIYLLARL